MSTTPKICILSPADIPLMRGMLETFANAFEDQKTYLDRQPSDAYLHDLLSKPHVVAICATMNEAVVGGLVAYQLDKFEQDRREFYIYDLAVRSDFRRQGIATAMIDTLRDETLRRDAYVIFVQADLDDAPAIALYDKIGAKETAHHFDIAPMRIKPAN